MENKRKRVPNFTADEKVFLTKLINDRKSIIESKQTDGKSIVRKKVAWETITLEFNSNITVYKRDTATLKRAWDNLKAMTRKARAIERGNLIRTGGGPSVPPQPPQAQAIIHMVEEASPALICEITNSFDSDAKALGVSSIMEPLDEFTLPSYSADNTENENNWDMESLPSQLTEAEEPLIDIQVIASNNNTKMQDATSQVEQKQEMPVPTRKACDYIRREAALRVKALEIKNKKDHQILKLKLDSQVNEKRRSELLLQAARMEFEAKTKEDKRAKLLLEAAKVELEFQKRRLEQLFPQPQ